jgi:hypothetical protein
VVQGVNATASHCSESSRSHAALNMFGCRTKSARTEECSTCTQPSDGKEQDDDGSLFIPAYPSLEAKASSKPCVDVDAVSKRARP